MTFRQFDTHGLHQRSQYQKKRTCYKKRLDRPLVEYDEDALSKMRLDFTPRCAEHTDTGLCRVYGFDKLTPASVSPTSRTPIVPGTGTRPRIDLNNLGPFPEATNAIDGLGTPQEELLATNIAGLGPEARRDEPPISADGVLHKSKNYTYERNRE